MYHSKLCRGLDNQEILIQLATYSCLFSPGHESETGHRDRFGQDSKFIFALS